MWYINDKYTYSAPSTLFGMFLILIGTTFLFLTDSAHISMSMLSIILFGSSLLFWKKSTVERYSSFFFGWILFYVVITPSLYLLFTHFISGGLIAQSFFTLMAWLFQVFTVLYLFFTHYYEHEDLENIFVGLQIAMVSSPALFVLSRFGKNQWEIENNKTILTYVVVGLLLFFIQLLLQDDKKLIKQAYQLFSLFISIMINIFIFLHVGIFILWVVNMLLQS